MSSQLAMFKAVNCTCFYQTGSYESFQNEGVSFCGGGGSPCEHRFLVFALTFDSNQYERSLYFFLSN
jgi:hypothetical protein